jgi:dephospho-CoA kinase
MIRNKPFLVGLTGGIACGKSNLSAALRRHGAVIIDADEISRGLTAPGGSALSAIRERFGDTVFDSGILDRRKLSDTVFNRKDDLDALNSIMHPLVFREMERQIAQNQSQTALIADVPLLYETGYEVFCREVWCAWAPLPAQTERLMQRGLSREEAMLRIKSQMPAMEKAKRASRVVVTTGSKEDNARAIIRLWDDLIRRCSSV